ncbi:MAG: winged helix-turn-helix domain-containing protein [Sulfuricaulis sp.]
MARLFRKLDPVRVWQLKERGLSNSQIAQRLGVTQGAVYHIVRKKDSKNKPDHALAFGLSGPYQAK